MGRLFQVLAIAVVVLIGIAWLAEGEIVFNICAKYNVGARALGRRHLHAALGEGATCFVIGRRFSGRRASSSSVPSGLQPGVTVLHYGRAKDQHPRWAKSFHAAVAGDDQKIGLTVEEYWAPELNESIGPLVGLGSPEDYLAPPGALCLYAKHDEWKTRFSELARRAASIIVEVSKSDNLRWEFERLRSQGLRENSSC